MIVAPHVQDSALMSSSGSHIQDVISQACPLLASDGQNLRLPSCGVVASDRDTEASRMTMFHPNGHTECLFSDGRRSVQFANGTEMHTMPNGSVSVLFANGDIKRTLISGQVEYFYREVDTWHRTMESGVEVWSSVVLK
jgi:T-complex protein 10 C-terminus